MIFGFSKVASLFSPNSVPGLVLWLKNETLLSFSDDAEIDQWSDNSSGAHHATQATSTKRPLKKTVSGKPCARFDGVNDVLTNTSLTAIGSGNFTFYCVLSISNTFSYRTFFKIGNASGANPMLTNHAGAVYINPEGSPTYITDGSLTISTVYWIRVYRSGATTYAVRNGATEASGALSHVSTAGYVVGDYHSSDAYQPFGGDIYEVLLYNENVSSANKTNIENYLAAKFSL